MPKPNRTSPMSVCQLRVVLRGISPLVWRRLLVRSDATLADLHAVLQVAFSWDDDHLHRFKIQGREFEGVDEYARVTLGDLGLRVTERFVYDYDFTDDWRHDIRVEQILAIEAGRSYPRCTGGRRAAPPEDCGGPWAYLEQTQSHRIYAAIRRVAEIMGQVLDDITLFDDYRDELVCLRPWLETERFDRQALNRALAGLPVPEERVA